ncbi:MAG TPA: DUF488 domain-containing protein [Candidatus Methylomirabilis sp.]|nr:DUF488 domain-containing protein [Candidatus Methylomirabilis sp.]
MISQTIYTVGHGNRKLDDLITLLTAARIESLVDVRAQPRSQHNPQFNDDSLRAACERAGIVYHWAGRQLGGLRTPRPGSPHVALEESRRGFADHMDTEAFRKGASQLQHLAARGACAILCAEREPAHCHRALIADYLTLQGMRVVHLIAPGESREHLLSPEARRESAALIYDRQTTGPLDLG